jgi:hypothetical protein
MSGRDGARGYLLQTLIAVFEALNEDDWSSIKIEPEVSDEKVDISFELTNGTKRVLQVKHSKNKFGKASVERWANELREARPDHTYELHLLGKMTDKVGDEVNGVRIKNEDYIDPNSHRFRACHALEKFLERRGSPTLPLFVRTAITDRLITELFINSTIKELIPRDDFQQSIIDALLKIYPAVASEREERIANLESSLRRFEKIANVHYDTKYHACLDALKIVDSVFSYIMDDPKFPPPKLQKTTAEELRNCHNRLIISVEDTRIVDVFLWLLNPPKELNPPQDLPNQPARLRTYECFCDAEHEKYYKELEEELNRPPGLTDVLNAFRNLIRKELGFGYPITLNENIAWMRRSITEEV